MGIPMPQDGWRLMLWTELGQLEVGAWDRKLLRGAEVFGNLYFFLYASLTPTCK